MKPLRAHTNGRLRLLAAAVLAASCCTPPLYAATQTARTLAPRPASAQTPHHPTSHWQHRPLKASERPPASASRDHLYVDYDRPERVDARLQKHTARAALATFAAAATTCDVNAIASASGGALVSLVRQASVNDCINSLFGLTGATAGQVFAEAKMVTIADALRNDAASYPGSNANGTLQLILFLRAGYYVQYYDSADVGSYGAALQGAIRPALDAFVANAHFRDVNDQHGAVLTEFVTLIDSAGENAHQLPAVRGLLDRYDASYHAYWYMMSAVNNVFTVLFRGHQNADFVAAVQASPDIVTALSGFVSRNAAEAGTDNEYLLANASRELARFLQYGSLRATVRPQVKSVLDRYAMTGAGASAWLAAADGADYYDPGNCSYYGTCNFRDQLAQVVLPITYQCSPDLRLRAQQLTSAQIGEVCSKVVNEEAFFHQKVNDNSQPVADDNNKTLELVVFHSSADYQTYSGVLFGNDTDNGGIYLEGDPTNPANQARFIAYEAEWMRPTFEVWNLTHEYVHYLDGRFDMYGDFGAAVSTPTIWWIEGLAEYLSYSYRGLAYPEAIADAGTGEFPLSTILANDYNSGVERVYRWGYLATRYMFERQPQEVGSILGYFRPGNYSGYGSYLQSIRYSHDADWSSWLACLSSNQGDTSSCGGGSTPPPTGGGDLPECTGAAAELKDGCQRSGVAASRQGDAQYFYIYVPANSPTLTFRTAGGTGDADLYVSGTTWPSSTSYEQRSATSGSNAESVTLTPKAAGGYYFVAVIARSPYSDVTVSAALGDTGGGNPPSTEPLPECTGSAGALQSGCQRSDVEAARQGDTSYFYILVPSGKTLLKVETAGGSGDADLYLSARGWPSASDYDQASTNGGNAESVQASNPSGNTYYSVAVTARQPYAGVTVKATLSP